MRKNKLDVMIIDDDPMVCDHLRKIVKWNDMSLNLICVATDSDTARELYFIYHPKIIITDINIPFISGLELAEEFAHIDPEIRFIIITGYDEFDYAQKSVKLGAVDLLLKPITSESINESLLKAVEYFVKLIQRNTSFEALECLLKDNLPIIRETFMASLLNQPAEQPEDIQQNKAKLGIEFAGKYFCVVIAANINPSPQNSKINDPVILLWKETLIKKLEQGEFEVYSFFDSQFRFNCMLSWNFEGGDDIVEDILEKATEHLLFLTQCYIYAGIGLTVSNLTELYKSYNEALAAYNYQSVLGDNTILHYKNISKLDGPLQSKDFLISNLLNQFKANDFIGISRTLSKYACKLSAFGHGDDRSLGELLFEYVSAIMLESMRQNLDVAKIEAFSKVSANLFYHQNPASQISYVLDLTKQLQKKLFEKRLSIKNHFINQALEYIEKHIADPSLSLDKVSDSIGFSRIYFCRLFHKEVGVNFSSYLKSARVERAKKLLKESNMRIFQIGEATGFANAKYFGYVFKQKIGMTPLEYRNMGAISRLLSN